jgi:hypothetical protein
MTRNLTSEIKAYSGQSFWTAAITALSGTVYYYWNGEGTRTISGHAYAPYLRIPSGFRRTRSTNIDSGEIELNNVDLTIQELLKTETFDGAACVVSKYLFGIDTLVEIFSGRLCEEEMRIDSVGWRLVSKHDFSIADAIGFTYAATCSHRFGKPRCGYTNASVAVTVQLAEQTADIYTENTIGRGALSMTPNAHKDRIVVITAGTGKGQARRISENSATILSVYCDWVTTPDATSKFVVVSAAYGLPKPLFTSTSAVFSATADIHTSRTIGYSGLAMATDEHGEDSGDDTAGIVRIVSGTGSGQERRIGSNTATTLTIADDDDDFSPAPGATSVFEVLYLRCPKDFGKACEHRGRTHAFSGAPTISPELTKLYAV